MSSNDVSILLNKLYKTKVSISELTEKHDKYRDMLAKIMSSKNTGKLDDGLYQISKRTFDRSSLGKKDVPHEIWDRYSKKVSVTTYTIKKIGRDKDGNQSD